MPILVFCLGLAYRGHSHVADVRVWVPCGGSHPTQDLNKTSFQEKSNFMHQKHPEQTQSPKELWQKQSLGYRARVQSRMRWCHKEKQMRKEQGRMDLNDFSEQPWNIQIIFLGLWVPHAKGMQVQIDLNVREKQNETRFPWSQRKGGCSPEERRWLGTSAFLPGLPLIDKGTELSMVPSLLGCNSQTEGRRRETAVWGL